MSTSAPPRIVLDTNILIAAIGSTSPYRWLFDAFLDSAFSLCVSTPILLEYEEVLARKTSPLVARNVLSLLLIAPNVERIEPRFHWHLISADPDDDKFVDTALMANVDAVVTHDAHFDVLKTLDFPRLQVLTAEEFRRLLESAG